MKLKERIIYLMEYYGVIIAASILFFVVIFSLFVGFTDSTEDVQVAAVNQVYSEDSREEMEKHLQSLYGTDEVELDDGYSLGFGNNKEYEDQGYFMKLSAHLISGELRMLILDEESFRFLAEKDALKDIRIILEQNLKDGIEVQFPENVQDSIGRDPEKIYGLKVMNEKHTTMNPFFYIAVPKRSNDEELLLRFYKLLTEDYFSMGE